MERVNSRKSLLSSRSFPFPKYETSYAAILAGLTSCGYLEVPFQSWSNDVKNCHCLAGLHT